MKKTVLLLTLSAALYSCSNNSQKSSAAVADSTGVQPSAALKSSEVDGLWTGIFSNSAEDEAMQEKANAFEKTYYEKLNGSQEGEEYEGDNDAIMDVKVIPAELRKAYYMEPLNGYYARRAPNRISLMIDGITATGELSGRSICAGNERPVKGILEKTNDGYKATLKEPGDDKNDGVFNVSFYTAAKKLTGSWQSQSGNVKPIMLTKTDFKYDAKAGEITGFRQKNKEGGYLEFKKNPSADLLTTADVENLTRPEISILRNLIFARHGYTFASPAFRNYFEKNDWYVPYKKDIRSDLTDTEKKNADKLKSYEKYAADTYDEFGR